LFVVGCVYNDFVKNLVKPRNKSDGFIYDAPSGSIKNPTRLGLRLNRADVSIRPEENVLQLGLLLVSLLDALSSWALLAFRLELRGGILVRKHFVACLINFDETVYEA